MMTAPKTYHADVERKARFEFISNTVGFGSKEIASSVYVSETSHKPSKNVLTNSGVVMVYSCETGKLITAFIASIALGTRIYRECFKCDRCPAELMKVFYNNQKYRENQP